MNKGTRTIYLLVSVSLVAMTAIVTKRLFVKDRIIIRGHSMTPTYYDGDTLWIYSDVKNRTIKAQDVVIFKHPYSDKILCKRCIAAAGDSVLFARSPFDTTLYSRLLYAPSQGDSLTFDKESFHHYRKCIAWETGKDISHSLDGYRFTQNWFYFLGDNRNHSVDSRHFGLVPESNIIGTVRITRHRK